MSHQKEFTLEEIADHRGKNSNWLLINDSVYDVTKFLAEHPGGEEVLLEQGGGDATVAFEDAGHPSDVRRIMDQYKIGILVGSGEAVKQHTQQVLAEEAKEEAEVAAKENQWPTWLIVLLVAVLPVLLYQLLGYVNWFDLFDM